MIIAIPSYRLSCGVAIDRGRAWSVVEELILWAVDRRPMSIADLSTESQLPRQIIVAALARLMRFRLTELNVSAETALFKTSEYGRDLIRTGKSLPFFPKRQRKRVTFVIERITGDFFPNGQVRVLSRFALEQDPDPDKRIVRVEGGDPAMSHEANFDRLAQIAAKGWEEHLASVDSRTTSIHSEYIVIRVVDGVPRNLPESAGERLRKIVENLSERPSSNSEIPIRYAGTKEQPDQNSTTHSYNFDPKDLVIGSSCQLNLLKKLLANAHRRVIIHSTFIDPRRFRELIDDIREACLRGVTFNLLWGAEVLGEIEDKNAASAVEIAKIVRGDKDLAGKFNIQLRSTGSHSKLLLADTTEGDWIAAVGSCNWLSSPFNAIELTAVLRDQGVVSDVCVAIQRMVGRRGLSDELATEMALVAKELRKVPISKGTAEISMIFGAHHDSIMRIASGEANRRIIVGSNRLGSTTRPGVVLQGETAAEHRNVDTTLLYSFTSGPLKKRHARKIAEEALENGVRLVKTDDLVLHGKFVVWDDDNIAITSLNWASASSDIDFPQADIGILIRQPGIANCAIDNLNSLFPNLNT